MAKGLRREGFGYGIPVLVQSPTDCRLADSCLFFPLGEGKSLSVVRNAMIIAAVVLLDFLSSPTAIARLIVAAVPLAVNGVFRSWSFTHVGKEILKRCAPAFANRNAASAVVFETVVLRSGATTNHAEPTLVGSRHCRPAGVTMLEVLSGSPIAKKAPTTLGATSNEIAAQGNHAVAAIAEAVPAALPTSIRSQISSNEQSFEPLIGHINEFGHNQSIRDGRGVVNGGYLG